MVENSSKAERFLQRLTPLQAALEAYCRRSLRDSSAVEDVLQNTVSKTFRDFHLYAEGTNFRAWVFKYLNLEIYAGNRQFQRRRHQSLPEEPSADEAWEMALNEPLFESLLENPEAVLDHCDESLAGAVADLKPLERSVLLLRAVGEFKYREIADILEVPIGTVMSSLARGRRRVRQRLVEFGEEQGWLRAQTFGKKR